MDSSGEDYQMEHPLAISTGGNFSIVGPLSNPIPSTHTFWAKPAMEDMAGASLEREFTQLRIDYESAVEKLNQTMYSIKTFWSPELKRERQLRREEGLRLAFLEERLAARTGAFHDTGAERIQELEDTCKKLAENLASKEDQVATLCMDGGGGRRALENALRHLDHKTERVLELEEEVVQLRSATFCAPRDFTQKGATGHELVTLRMKLERSEVELSERKAELANFQTRLRNAEDELTELRAHAQLLKEHSSGKEEHCSLLQADVEALRCKLELRHQIIEQKEAKIAKLEKELVDAVKDGADRADGQRNSDQRCGQLIGRLESVEGQLRDREIELEKTRHRLASHPDSQKERELIARIEHGERERQRLEKAVDEVRLAAEKEHKQQLETYQTEVTRLRASLLALENELADRDVLLESQNEKIGDVGRELAAAEHKMQEAMVEKGEEELRLELEAARGEVEKLLRMLHSLQKEHATLSSKLKQLQATNEENRRPERDNTINTGHSQLRIQELEEALAESVSITAEREVVLSQQKQLLQQTSTQLAESRREISELLGKISCATDADAMVASLAAERKEHLEQLICLKVEALLSAIAEKEAHISLLERSNAPREQIESIRRQREALMKKLKQENDRRHLLLQSSGVPAHSPVAPPSRVQSAPAQARLNIDEKDGIWA